MSNLKDVRQKGVSLILGDGKERSLLFDMNAFAELEDIYGSFQNAVEAMSGGSFKAIRAVIWAGLLHAEPDLSQKEVGSLITFNDFVEINKKIGEALNVSMPLENEVSETKNE